MCALNFESEEPNQVPVSRMRGREERVARFALPPFDSLPANAGLNNTEAFQLSIRHALSLLPALLARGMDERLGEDHPNRFSI